MESSRWRRCCVAFSENRTQAFLPRTREQRWRDTPSGGRWRALGHAVTGSGREPSLSRLLSRPWREGGDSNAPRGATAAFLTPPTLSSQDETIACPAHSPGCWGLEGRLSLKADSVQGHRADRPGQELRLGCPNDGHRLHWATLSRWRVQEAEGRELGARRAEPQALLWP